MKFSLAAVAALLALPTGSLAIWENIVQGNGNSTFLRDLLSRNKEIAVARNASEPGFYERAAATKQAPSGILVACSDSRLPDAVIAGQRSGELFVVRNIANLVLDTETAARASIEYGVADLGAYRIIVMGHDGCGGIIEGHAIAQAEIAQDAGYEVTMPHLPEAVAKWLKTITKMVKPILLTYRSETPLVRKRGPSNVFNIHDHIHHRRAEGNSTETGGALGPLEIKKATYDDPSLKLAIEENVKRQVNNIADDVFIQSQWALGKNVSIHGWVYSLSTGIIRDLAVSRCLGGSCWNQGRTDGFGSLQPQ